MKADIIYDAGPTGCGELIVNIFLTMKTMKVGQILLVTAYDPGAKADIPAWCRLSGNELVFLESKECMYYYIMKK
jgi:tRNA 2-thiouridine synthesizing protein A